jgi:hypothetical protein
MKDRNVVLAIEKRILVLRSLVSELALPTFSHAKLARWV